MFAANHESRVDRALGELSYPVYITHYPLVFVLHALGSAWLEANFGWITLVLTLVLAYALFHYVGEPIERTRRRISGGLARADRRAPA
jgi:peptidoglycan/LPS O-acetylase OafA/YrhL